jgi:hypothetical protein
VTAIRLSPALRSRLDDWCKEQDDQPSRSEAIRRLVEHALGPSPATRPGSRRKAQKASELADRAAEQIVDKSIPSEEQQRRKRALIKGPKEFREIRERSAKGKGLKARP